MGTAIDEPFHLSFPYVFEYRKKLYLIPDSSSNKDIRIYKCKKFPLKWKLHKILVKDILATDSLVFKSRKNWHMLTNMRSNKTNDLNSELFYLILKFQYQIIGHTKKKTLYW